VLLEAGQRARPASTPGPPPRQRGTAGNTVISLAEIGDLAGYVQLAGDSFRRNQRPNDHRRARSRFLRELSAGLFASGVNTDAGVRWREYRLWLVPVRG
jgi:hypothetical protein